eukprot:TRINITY_DN6345_c0_g1_i1.p1 TRINITY_DN6345_c0_g1~~TRINITY_DN6345_c0_g1_i1.p1  ORF type:complete len:1718 (+),score=384.96 TRINITY_DN6345_c0_g1_i1:405-5156(+)
MAKLLKKSRPYFEPNASRDICELLFPRLREPDRLSVFQAQWLLVALLPVNSPAFREWWPQTIAMWGWLDNSEEWKALWAVLHARTAQYWSAEIDWARYLPTLMTHVYDLLDMPVGTTKEAPKATRAYPREMSAFFSTEHHGSERVSINACGKMLVAALSDAPLALSQLNRLFSTLASFFHPSNDGPWSVRIGLLLESIARYALKRRSLEINPKKSPLHASGLSNPPVASDTYDQLAALLLPVALQAIYSRHPYLSLLARSAIQHLSNLSPSKTLPILLERTTLALQTVTATHQTASAIELLSSIVPMVLRSGELCSEYLPQILEITLLGIDSNDALKTAATLKFYYGFLCCVPLLEPAAPESDEQYARLTALDYSFSVWAHQLLERALLYLELLDKKGKQSGWWDPYYVISVMLERLFSLLFMQSSLRLHEELCTVLKREISRSTFTNAHKELGSLLRSACHSHPEQTLAIFLPEFVAKISKAVAQPDSAGENAEKYFRLLSRMIRFSQTPLLPHLETINGLVRLALAHDSKKIKKLGLKLLKAMLISQTSVYLSETRSHPPSVWNSPEFLTTHTEHWAETLDDFALDAHPHWHRPTSSQFEAAAAIATAHLESALHLLAQHVVQPASSSKEALRTGLQTVRYLLRGCPALFYSQSSSNVSESDSGDRAEFFVDLGEDEDGSDTAGIRIMGHAQDQPPVLARFSEEIARTLHKVAACLLSDASDDVANLKLLAKVISVALNFRGGPRDKNLRTQQQLYTMIKAKFRVYNPALTQKGTHFRVLALERLSNLHHLRLNQLAYSSPFTEQTQQLLEDLVALSLTQYAAARKVAQEALARTVRHHFRAAPVVLPHLIEKIKQASPEADRHIIKGAIFALEDSGLRRRLLRMAHLRTDLLLALCHAPDRLEGKEKQKAVALFTHCVKNFSQVSIFAHSAQIEGSWLARRHRETLAAISALESGAQNLIQNPSAHWQSRVLAAVCVAISLRSDRLLDPSVLETMLQQLLSDIAPLRRIALFFSATALLLSRPDAIVRPATLHGSLNLVQSDAAQLQAVSVAHFSDQAYFTHVVQRLVNDHHTLDADAGAQNLGPDKTRELLLALQHSTRRTWPVALDANVSAQFQNLHAQFLAALLHACGASVVLGAVLQIATDLAEVRRRDSQLALSELAAGLLRHYVIAQPETTGELREAVTGLCSRGLWTAGPEAADDWATALRFALSGLSSDYQRNSQVAHLVELLASAPATSVLASGNQWLYLRVLAAELRLEGSNKTMLIDLLNRAGLSSPFKRVRTDMADTLALLLVGEWVATQIAAKAVGSEAGAATAMLELILGVSGAQEDAADLKNKRDMLLLVIVGLYRYGVAPAVQPFLSELVRAAALMQETRDEEIFNLSAAALGLMGRSVSQQPLETIGLISELGANPSWHVRLALLPFTQVFGVRHLFVLELGKILLALLGPLKDSQLEVRKLASQTMAGFLRSASAVQIGKLRKMFSAWTKDKATATRHGGVLGFAALALSRPYDVPEWLPEVLVALSAHQHEPEPVKGSVRATIAEFWRTHKDMWDVEFRELFTPEQVDAITSIVPAPAYYA